jgi:hypothetical protein
MHVRDREHLGGRVDQDGTLLALATGAIAWRLTGLLSAFGPAKM